MKTPPLKHLVILGLFLLTRSAAAAPLELSELQDLSFQAGQLFRQANDLSQTDPVQARQFYQQAVLYYQKIIDQGKIANGYLYYNIANAYLLTRISATPEKPKLLQNYPNPFNPETWIPFQLSEDSSVRVDIYNLSGHLIRRLNLGYRSTGWHISREQAVYWDGKNSAGESVASGIYFYKLQAGDFVAAGKMIAVK